MNLLQIYIHNGERLYLKEGFPEPPNRNDFDANYKLPFDWRVVEQWQRKLKNGTETWRDEPEIAINHYKELKYQTRLIACLIPSKVNTTASDKTGYNEERRCRLGLEILKKHIRGDFYSTGHLHMKIYEAMEEYASQFRGEMTTK